MSKAEYVSVLPSLDEIERAATLVYRSMPATPQYNWPQIDQRAGAEVWVKHENHTPVGRSRFAAGCCIWTGCGESGRR